MVPVCAVGKAIFNARGSVISSTVLDIPGLRQLLFLDNIEVWNATEAFQRTGLFGRIVAIYVNDNRCCLIALPMSMKQNPEPNNVGARHSNRNMYFCRGPNPCCIPCEKVKMLVIPSPYTLLCLSDS